MRLATLLVLAALSNAPLQCASDPEPEMRRYETPGEALYELAARLESQGNQEGWKTTLGYLIERYPNSRFAARARDDLNQVGGSSATP